MEQGFECLIMQPTRIAASGNKTTSTLIDVLLSNKPDLFKHSGIYHPSLSDHCLTYGILKDKMLSHRPKVITFRSYKNFDECLFKESLSMAPWHVGEIFDEIDDPAYYWSTLLRNVVDDQLPLKKMRVRDKDVPYMTTGWKQAIHAKRRATMKYKNHPAQENWENKKKCRNEATRQRRLAIKEHWRKKADDLKKNPRDFFKTFRPFLSTKGHKGEIEIHLRTDGDVVEKDQSRVADLFADYFAMIADGIGGDKSKLDSPEDFQDHPSVAAIANNIKTKQQYDIEPISNAHVERALKSLTKERQRGIMVFHQKS